MQINKMTATFGSLENASLEPGSGLSIIYAPNESGKSTWCAFIRAMLYGVDTAERERSGVKPDKIKYAPWSGAPMEGRMELTRSGRDITLTRKSRGGAPMRELSAVYTGTNEPAGISPSNAGEALTGMPRGVFERSVFIKQSGLSVSGNPDLEKRIAAIVSTGAEDSSYTEADERLRAWQRKRRYNKRGALPELEAEISRLELELKEVRAAAAEASELEAAIPQYQRQAALIEAQIQESRKEQRKAALARMAERRRLLREKEEAVEAAKAEASERLGALRASAFGDRPPEEVTAEAKADLEKAVLLEAEAATVKSPIPGIVLGAAATASLITGAVLASFIAIAIGAVFLICAVVSFIFYRKRILSANAAREALGLLLQKYRVVSPEGISAAADAHSAAYRAWIDAGIRTQMLSSELEEMREEQKDADAGILSELDFSGAGGSEAAALGRELNRVSGELARAREMAALARGRLETLGDPMVMESELLSLRERREELEEQYSALALAIGALGNANTEIQTRFSPRLGKRATALMSRLTGGRYDELTLDRQLSARARLKGDITPRESSFLSAGALDQMYLALRIAICELALPEGEACPMILDDALASFDDARMGLALDLLLELSEERQILLFTCHSREAEYFKNNPEVKIIGLYTDPL